MRGPIKDTDLYPNKQGSNGGAILPYRLLNYTITDAVGNKKYLTALIYNEVYVNMVDQAEHAMKAVCPKALIFVSLYPKFHF